MKKIFFGTAIALSVLSGCSDVEEQDNNSIPNGTIQASFEQGSKNSRLAMNDSHELLWTTDDAFKMFDVKGNGYVWTLDGEGGVTGTFVGIIPNNTIKGAIYPNVETTMLNGEQLTMTLPATLTYDENGKLNLPMWASFSSIEEPVAFKHLGALLKVNFSDIPEGYSSLIVSADRPVADRLRLWWSRR